MKVAIIGAGNIANVHAKALRGLGQEIVAAVSKDDSAKSFAQHWGITHAASSIQEVLEYDFDVAHICTPPALHYEQIKALLLAGKHVVSEKPFTLDGAQAKELCTLAEQRALFNAVCFNNRYYAAIQQAKSLLSGDVLHLAWGSYLQAFHRLPCAYSWRYDEALAGKMRAVTEIASHWIDLLSFLTGQDVVQVSALFQCETPLRGLENGVMIDNDNAEKTVQVLSEDSAVVHLRLSGGTLASLVVSETMYGKTNELCIQISGKQRSVAWNSENPYRLDYADAQGSHSSTHAFSGAFNETFADFIRDVYDAMQGANAAPVYADFSQAAKNVAVCEAIYQSAKQSGKYIEVSL